LVHARTAFSKSKLGFASTSSWPSSPHSRAAASTAAAHSAWIGNPCSVVLQNAIFSRRGGLLISSA
jgi:hypothetical protein